MRKIIVTVKDFDETFSCDMEIPADVRLYQVLPLMRQNAAAISGDSSYQKGDIIIFCPRTGIQAELLLSAEENGIRNGDWLVLIERS